MRENEHEMNKMNLKLVLNSLREKRVACDTARNVCLYEFVLKSENEWKETRKMLTDHVRCGEKKVKF